MPGPPPKHPSARARRNDPKKDFRVLSTEGRQGETPPWPLQPDIERTSLLEVQRDRIANLQVELDATDDGRTRGRLTRELNKLEIANAKLALEIEQAVDAEQSLWAELWETPQAVLWEESHAYREVAQYVRWKIREEQGDIKVSARVQGLSDRLGLTPKALLGLRTDIERVDEAEHQGERRRAASQPRPAPKKAEPDDPRSILSVVN